MYLQLSHILTKWTAHKKIWHHHKNWWHMYVHTNTHIYHSSYNHSNETSLIIYRYSKVLVNSSQVPFIETSFTTYSSSIPHWLLSLIRKVPSLYNYRKYRTINSGLVTVTSKTMCNRHAKKRLKLPISSKKLYNMQNFKVNHLKKKNVQHFSVLTTNTGSILDRRVLNH